MELSAMSSEHIEVDDELEDLDIETLKELAYPMQKKKELRYGMSICYGLYWDFSCLKIMTWVQLKSFLTHGLD